MLLADDQELVRRGFGALISAEDGLEVVGEAATGAEAIDQAFATRPDVILMDIRMPELDGIAATARITADDRLSDTQCAGAHHIRPRPVRLRRTPGRSLRVPAQGHRTPSNSSTPFASSPPATPSSLRESPAGSSASSPPAPTRPRSQASLDGLTERERDVLVEVGQGHNNAEIAERLFISPLTAKTHVSRIMRKLAARDRAQLVVIAYETGLVTPGD